MTALVPLTAADRRKMLWWAGSLLTLLAFIAFFQANQLAGTGGGRVLVGPVWARLLSGTLPAWLGALLIALLPERWQTSVSRAAPGCVAIAVIAAGVRVGLQQTLGVYATVDVAAIALEFSVGFGVALVTGLLVVGAVWQDRRERAGQIEATIARARAEAAISALRDEEERLGRAVAEGLHGTLQQRLVLLNVQLESLGGKLAQAGVDAETIAEVTELAGQIDVLREETVRATSRLLAPEGIDIGVVPAVRLLLGRLPSSIRYSMTASPELRDLDSAGASIIPAMRLLVVRVVEESLTNALRHGHATSFQVDLSLMDASEAGRQHAAGDGSAQEPSRMLHVEVGNDGAGFDPAFIELSGLSRLRSRVELAGGTLEVRSSPDAPPGTPTTVIATFPLGS